MTNTGAIRVETGTLEFDAGLINSGAGTAHVASGATLRIGGGGSSGASAFTVAAGAMLEFAQIFPGPNVFTLGAGTVGGPGTVAVSGGELALGTGAVTVAGFAQGNATQSNCTVSGSGTLTVTGSAAFTGGAMRQTGPGVTLLEGSSTLAGNVVGGLFLEGGRVLENQGTFTLSSGFMELGSGAGGATLRNDAGGTIDLQGIATIARGAGATVLINAGLLEKTAGAGAAIVGVAVVNTGAIVARARHPRVHPGDQRRRDPGGGGRRDPGGGRRRRGEPLHGLQGRRRDPGAPPRPRLRGDHPRLRRRRCDRHSGKEG